MSDGINDYGGGGSDYAYKSRRIPVDSGNCKHERLNEDGVCRSCGGDERGIGEPTAPVSGGAMAMCPANNVAGICCCAYPYEGTQMKGTPPKCERCNGLLPVSAPTNEVSAAEVKRYVKKPIPIEAVQLTWANWFVICDFVPMPWFVRGVYLDKLGLPMPGDGYRFEGVDDMPNSALGLLMRTLESQEFLAKGNDWIIKGVAGEFYACKPDIFAATYQLEADHLSAMKEMQDKIDKLEMQLRSSNQIREAEKKLLIAEIETKAAYKASLPERAKEAAKRYTATLYGELRNPACEGLAAIILAEMQREKE